jgi:drug/metabolite transporter (DMT)-like permease
MDANLIASWTALLVGALVTFFANALAGGSNENEDGEAKNRLQRKIYLIKIFGLLLVIIGAVCIFWAGGNVSGR